MKIAYRPILHNDNLYLSNLIKNVFIEYNADYHAGTIFSDPTTNNLYELFQAQKSICWVALEKEEVVGCCGIFPTEDLPNGCVELVKFYITEKSRGKGIGKTLLQKCEKTAKKLGYTQLYLESLPEFKNAVDMYRRSGFTYLNSPLGNSGHFGCNIWMVKDL